LTRLPKAPQVLSDPHSPFNTFSSAYAPTYVSVQEETAAGGQQVHTQ
jgi:hypothetical protein